MDSALVAMLPSKLQGFPCNKMSPTPRPHESFTNLARSELKGLNRSQESPRKEGNKNLILFPRLELTIR